MFYSYMFKILKIYIITLKHFLIPPQNIVKLYNICGEA